MGNSPKAKKHTLLIVGLDNSGKSAIIASLKQPSSEPREIGATVGFKQETFQYLKRSFEVFDMSGQSKYRSLWETHFEQA